MLLNLKDAIVLTSIVHWIIGVILLATLNKRYDMTWSIVLFVFLTIVYYLSTLTLTVHWTRTNSPNFWSICYWILLALVPVVSFGGHKKVGSGPIGAAAAQRAEENSRADPSKDQVYGETIAHVWWVAITIDLILKYIWYKHYKKHYRGSSWEFS